MKIVLDTNCLLPSIFSNSPYSWLWERFCEGRFVLCFSTDMYHEYEEMMTQFYSPDISESVMQTIMNAANIELVIPWYKWNLIEADPDDNKFVDCALNTGADYIVTNDHHFNVLKTLGFPPVKVVNIEMFKTILMLQD
jgi:putative PIN family toxin of toxin-antitoxin system